MGLPKIVNPKAGRQYCLPFAAGRDQDDHTASGNCLGLRHKLEILGNGHIISLYPLTPLCLVFQRDGSKDTNRCLGSKSLGEVLCRSASRRSVTSNGEKLPLPPWDLTFRAGDGAVCDALEGAVLTMRQGDEAPEFRRGNMAPRLVGGCYWGVRVGMLI